MIEYRPWGFFKIIYKDDQSWLKRLHIAPGQSTSYQYHLKRFEYWMPESKGIWAEVRGSKIELLYPRMSPISVPPRVEHRLYNPTQEPVSVLEWATGNPDESDIVRIRDLYGR